MSSFQLGPALLLACFVIGTSEVCAQPPAVSEFPPPSLPLTPSSCQVLPPVAGETLPTPRKREEFELDPENLFRLESESAFRARLERELTKVKDVQFPKDAPVVTETRTVVWMPPRIVGPVAAAVCYRPLYFEDKPVERFGEYVPCLQPLCSTGRFLCDALMLPCHMALAPPWTFECDNR